MIVKLLVVHGQPAGKVLFFGLGEHLLGRGLECRVRFNSDLVSRQHCLLRVEAAGSFLRDLASRNGTLVNGRLCEGERELADGDMLQVGPLVFKVRLEADDTAQPPEPEQPATVEPEDGKPAASSLAGTEPHTSLPRKP
jgi:pSer/pThr/pTyr-binding forkhead associated (FHA) protein